jgi:hypothetical protein
MKKKKYIIMQKPNLPIIAWFVTFILLKIPYLKIAHPVLSLISFGAIFTWAWLEIFQGVNAFRRTLGGIVMTYIIISRIGIF